MVARLITLPLRVSIRGAQLWFRAAEEVAGRATLGALRVASVFTRDGHDAAAAPSPPSPRRTTPEPDPRRSATPEPAQPEPVSAEDSAGRIDRSADAATQPAPAPAPAHVSEEPELVREEAEPGAEDGAGASVVVQEPWDGYARMSAKEVIARLSDANPAELAAVSLYESGNRSRQTVLEAVQRQFRTANAGSQE